MSDRQLPTAEGNGGPAAAPEANQPPAWRLVGTLGSAAAVAGLAIVLVYQWAQPRIAAHRAEALRTAVRTVLGGPESYRPMYVLDGELLSELPAGADSADAQTVYAGFDGGQLIGFAVPGEKPGYQDVVRLIFGYDPAGDLVLGMTVLQSKETPGLGAKITSDSSFIREFADVEPPLQGVKEGGDEPGEVDMITGATISSETVIEVINERLETLGPVLREAAGSVATSASAPPRGAGSNAADGGRRTGGDGGGGDG